MVGIIPGPSEPSHDINTFLEPLIRELIKFWEGIPMDILKGSIVVNEIVRCAILCCACDLPAGRKVCGFLGHSATLGCSKCLKCFSGAVGSMNYSGFERSSWIQRTNDSHRENIQRILKCKTKTEQKRLESQLGSQYSALIELPYFDPPRMLIVDPMHNLFLGSGKHILHLWLEHGHISHSHFQVIQELVDSFIVPSDVGRIPRKIEANFSGFTADQFKNWIITYSIPCLHSVLPSAHLECWRFFVLACRIFCKYSLSMAEIHLVDALLLKFCAKVQVNLPLLLICTCTGILKNVY